MPLPYFECKSTLNELIDRNLRKKSAGIQKAVVAKSKVMEKAKAPKKMDETKTEFRLTKVL